MRMVSGHRLGLAVLMAMAGAGCNGDSGEPNQSPLVLAKAPTKSGDEQTGQVGVTLGNDLRVLVTRDDQPVNGVTVAWFVSEGSVNPASSQTDPDGIATTAWTLGAATGTKAATATVTNATGSPLAFTALAVSAGGGGVTIEVLGPDGGNRFEPSSVTLLEGSTVTWHWPAGSLAHNVTPDDGLIPQGSGALADGEHVHSYTFTTPGTFRFHCANHGGLNGAGMSGTVTVVPGGD